MPGKSAIEIEEEYIDTYHIAKNYTINNSDEHQRRSEERC